MSVVVAPEAERELIDGAIFYGQEANADLGFAFIAEFERALAVLAAVVSRNSNVILGNAERRAG